VSSPQYLVTGAAGFIGSHSVDCLLAAGHQVVGIDNLRTGHLQNLKEAFKSNRFEFIQADITDETVMDELFRTHTFSGVLHLAALVSVPESFSEPGLNSRINLVGSDIIARLCIKHSCKRIVFASSSAVYGDAVDLPCSESFMPQPLSPYGAAKLAAENMLLGYASGYDLEAVCFRYFNIYGLRQDPGSPYSGVLSIFTDRLRQGLPITVYGDGEQTRDFVAVKDVAKTNCFALTATSIVSGRYNVCTGNSISLNQILTLCREYYPQAPAVRYDVARQGDIRHSLGDPKLIHDILGITLSTPFTEGLQELICKA
jgi:UDP-glucose 4-epimerase